ncbi:POTRA domain-containing protein [Nguyenibacter vanlangensis]|uniref:POTRA domain-containing protein n=2 Tax=Nguyenibacter vanlangensis TaxID=1216886 RepID=A0ABZ3D4I1_9PROT
MRTTRHLLARAALAVTVATGTAAAVLPQTAAFAAAPPAPNAPLKLKSLVVTGNKQVTTDEILAAIPFHQGDTVTRNQIDAAVQDVMGVYQKKNVGLKFGEKLKFAGNAVNIQWIIEEQAPQAPAAPAALVVDKIVFEGNKKISSDDLAAAIPLHAGSPIDQASMAAAQTAVQKLYQKRDITASIQAVPTQPQGDNHVILTFQISEKSGD